MCHLPGVPAPKQPEGGLPFSPNLLSFCLQPDEGFHQQFEGKIPDIFAKRQSAVMAFHYQDVFGPSAIPDAYERLLLEALNGDTSLFTRNDWLELAWEILDPILDAWQAPDPPPLHTYTPGSWGPKAADVLLERDGRTWMNVCGIHKNLTVHPTIS